MTGHHRGPAPRFAGFLALVLLAGCAGEPVNDPDATAGKAETEAVEYEPAYPEEVSVEGLSEDDVAQQERHTHGDGTSHVHDEGAAHDHGDGGHEHDGGDDHEH